MKFRNIAVLLLGAVLFSSPAMAAGGDSLQEATQRGANYLVADVLAFAKGNNCQACHRQGAALFGLAEAISNGYTIDEGDTNGIGFLAVQNVSHQEPWRGTGNTGRYLHSSGAGQYQHSTSSYAGYGLAGYDRFVSTRFSADLVEAADDAVIRQTVNGNLGYWNEQHHHFPTTFGYVQNAARHIEVLRAARGRADATRQAAYDTAIARAVAYIRSRATDYTASNTGTGHVAVGYTFQAAWALLGLKAAGVASTDADVIGLQNRLLSTTSNTTGSGWGYTAAHDSDPYNTGLALYALCQAGKVLSDTAITDAANWLNSQQATSGVWNSPTHSSHDVPTTFAMLGLGCFGSLGVDVATSGVDRVQVSSNVSNTQTVTFTVVVSNTGSFGGTDSYTVAVLGGLPGWSTALSSQVLTLTAGSSATVTLTVTTASNLPAALPVDFSVRATSQTSARVSSTANVTVYTDPPPPVTGLDTTVTLTGAPATKPVTWGNVVGVWDAPGDGLYRHAGSHAWNAEAYSNEQISSGRGYVEWVAGERNTYKMMGLSHGNTDASWQDIDFALYMVNDGRLQVREKGSTSLYETTYQPGDVLRVQVDNGVVTYHQNGSLLYTSAAAATYPLNIDSAFFNVGSSIRQVRLSGSGSAVVVPTWSSLVDVTQPTSLLKTLGSNAWDSGAYSKERITDGSGYVEFTVNDESTHRMVGLSNGNTNSSWQDIDFAWYPVNDGRLQVRESGSNSMFETTYQTGDVLRVQVDNGAVTYFQNGTLRYTSSRTATYPLNVDSSFYNTSASVDGVTISGNLLGSVTSRTANTVLAARVHDVNGTLVTGPASGVVTFYVAGVPVANDIDADGDGLFQANWAPGSGWASTGEQDYRAIYSGIDRPDPQPDLLPSLASTTLDLALGLDTDSDGLEDALETDVVGTNPHVADTDGDGCLDGFEYNILGSSPLVVDTDGDGVGDCDEFNAGTDPGKDTSFPDADNDGVSDGADPFPCDPDKASVVFVPAEGQYGQLAFEDNWPDKGDLDFNDSVFGYNYKVFRNSDALVTEFTLTIEPLALGAIIESGIAIRLPTSATAIASATRVITGGSATSLQASVNESEVVVVLANNVRELFGNRTGLINVDSAAAMIDAPQIEVTLRFTAPFSLAMGEEPFDLFYFRTTNVSHQIHRPLYQGTDTMDTGLFGTRDDGSSSSRWFVDTSGLPFVIATPQLGPWTTEFTALTGLFPNLVTFAASNGVQATDFYQSQVVASKAYPPSLNLGPTSGGVVDVIPPVVYDRSCTTIPLGL